MKKTFLFILLSLNNILAFSQNITAKIEDRNSKSPIAFATIKTGEFSGVISNEEGYFTILEKPKQNDSITISCLGYETKIVRIQDITSMGFVILLEESVNKLNTVYVSNKKPNADDIISKVRQHLDENYETKLYTYRIFSRETAYINFEKLDFKIEKASHVKKNNLVLVNKSLDSLSTAIINSKTIHFKDFKGNLLRGDSTKTKLTVDKATELIDQKNNLSIDDVQHKTQNIILKYLDTTLTYKLKTGLFKIDDSLSLKESEHSDKQKDEDDLNDLKQGTNTLLNRSQFYENSMLSKILDSNLYEYTFKNITFFNDNLIYIINYKPKKSKSKYTGTLYINDETFAITKVDFEFADGKRGEKLNLKLLLGVKYVENIRKGSIIYHKNYQNKYQPQYIKFEEGRYFYVSRPLKFIENSPEKNKTSFDFTIEGNIMTKQELLVTSNTKITIDQFKKQAEEKTVPFMKLNKYDASVWGTEQTLEPLQEMKEFKSKQ